MTELYVCIKHNPICRSGTILAGNMEDGLIRGRIVKSGRNPRDTKFTPMNAGIAIPFKSLADYIIPMGFKIPMSIYRKVDFNRNFNAAPEVKEVEDFQHEHEDIIEPELERRGKEANPTLTGRGMDEAKPDDPV